MTTPYSTNKHLVKRPGGFSTMYLLQGVLGTAAIWMLLAWLIPLIAVYPHERENCQLALLVCTAPLALFGGFYFWLLHPNRARA